MNKRANTPEQKKEICDRLYKWWLENPELRLGQLISWGGQQDGTVDLFYVEDYDLVPQPKDINELDKGN